MNSVDLEDIAEAIYSILTIPANIKEMSANLKAPIVINNKKKIAKQIVLQDNKLTVKYEMYKQLKQFIVAYSSDDSVRTKVSDTHRESTETVVTSVETTTANPSKESIQ
jgi:flagellar assembly factor FliW